MGRCSICDWSPDTYSLFQNSSVDGDKQKRLVNHQGELLCSVCYEEVQGTVADYALDDGEESAEEYLP